MEKQEEKKKVEKSLAVEIPLNLIRMDMEGNHRKTFTQIKMEELTASVKKKGVLEPILLRPIDEIEEGMSVRYEIIAGTRRYRASINALRKTIPAIIKECTKEEAGEISLVENLQREDIHPLEEGMGQMKAEKDDWI